jgi:hypothetical protein
MCSFYLIINLLVSGKGLLYKILGMVRAIWRAWVTGLATEMGGGRGLGSSSRIISLFSLRVPSDYAIEMGSGSSRIETS